MSQLPTATMASPTPSAQRLTPDQVCDLPLGELLAHVNGSLAATEINEPGFFGYVIVATSGRFTICIPTAVSDTIRDAAIRFLITTHLGLPTHLFPDVFEATVYSGAGVKAALA